MTAQEKLAIDDQHNKSICDLDRHCFARFKAGAVSTLTFQGFVVTKPAVAESLDLDIPALHFTRCTLSSNYLQSRITFDLNQA